MKHIMNIVGAVILIFLGGCQMVPEEKSIELLYWETGNSSLLLGLTLKQKLFMKEMRRDMLNNKYGE